MQKRTIVLTGLGAVAGLAVIGNIVGDEPTDEPAAAVEEAPAPSPEPEPATTEAPAPEPTPEPEPVEAPTPPNASDDLDRILLESVWNTTDRQAQDDMCLLYTISPAAAWEAFVGDEGDAPIARHVFDEHFTEVC